MDQAVEDFGHILGSILTDFVNTPDLDVFFDEADAVPSSGFLLLVGIFFDTSRLKLAPSI